MISSTFTRVALLATALLAPLIASAQVSSVPPGAQRCADDFGTCALPGNWPGGKIYYGAGNRFVVIPVGPAPKPFVCLPQTFKIADPVPNVKKTCYAVAGATPTQAAPAKPAFPTLAAVPAGSQRCADDFGTCTPPANWASLSNGKLYYGASGKFVEIPMGPATKPFVCLPNTFGIADPVPNVKKTCYLLAGGAVPQLKPIAMPKLAAPSNLTIAAVEQKAPVPVVVPLLMTAAQQTEYRRWTDAQREEFIEAYQRLTTDPGRLDLLNIRFNTKQGVTPTAYRSTTDMGAAVVSALPAGVAPCGTAGKLCYPRNPKNYVFFGAGNKFAVAVGAGAFTCAAKGTVKTPSIATPGDLGVDDPAPGVAKSCYTDVPVEAVRAVIPKKLETRPLITCKKGDAESKYGGCDGAATCPAPNAFITPPATVVEPVVRNTTFCGRSVAAQVPCPVAPAGLNAVAWIRTAYCQHTPNCGDQTFDPGNNRCMSPQSTGGKVLGVLTNNLAGSVSPSTKPGCYEGFTYNSQTKLCAKNSTPPCPAGFFPIHVKVPESAYADSCVQIQNSLITCNDPYYLAQKGVSGIYSGVGEKCTYTFRAGK